MQRLIPFWLSFCADDGSFLGVSLVYAEDVEDAVRQAWLGHCNPGGQVAITDLRDVKGKPIPDARWFNRILTREEVDVLENELRALS